MKALKYKDKNGEYQTITPIVINQGDSSLPEDGEVGQVLTKTEDGVEWKDTTSTIIANDLSDEYYSNIGAGLNAYVDMNKRIYLCASGNNMSLSILERDGNQEGRVSTLIIIPGSSQRVLTIPSNDRYIRFCDDTITIPANKWAEVNVLYVSEKYLIRADVQP